MMNEGMYIALRNYAEEQSSLLRQILEAQNKTNEMLSQLLPKPTLYNEMEKAASARTATNAPLVGDIYVRDTDKREYVPATPKDEHKPRPVAKKGK